MTKETVLGDNDAYAEQFWGTIRDLRLVDESAHIVVGHAINYANSLLVKRFDSLRSFQRLSLDDQYDFIDGLEGMRQDLINRDLYTAIGIYLFTVWLVTIVEKDTESAAEYAKELGRLSQKGDLSGLV